MRNTLLTLACGLALAVAVPAGAQSGQPASPSQPVSPPTDQTGTRGHGTSGQPGMGGQTGTTSGTGGTATGTTKAGQQGSTAAGSQGMAKGGPVRGQAFVKKAAEGGKAEVALGQMVQDKATDNDVKQFAQMMVTDHTKANDELAALAKQKGWTLPDAPGPEHKAVQNRLEKLSGAELDRAYMRAMVKDHHEDVTLFSQAAGHGTDPDLKAWAEKTLPTLQEHLKRAQEISSRLGGGAGEKAGHAGKSGKGAKSSKASGASSPSGH